MFKYSEIFLGEYYNHPTMNFFLVFLNLCTLNDFVIAIYFSGVGRVLIVPQTLWDFDPAVNTTDGCLDKYGRYINTTNTNDCAEFRPDTIGSPSINGARLVSDYGNCTFTSSGKENYIGARFYCAPSPWNESDLSAWFVPELPVSRSRDLFVNRLKELMNFIYRDNSSP
jgi:hypothetical protein